ncbi:MAG: hypothetical protein J6S67_19920 [Methanobrevibacter sp.]|nr:hypothetical protein [Methanobrevibacter sp.]
MARKKLTEEQKRHFNEARRKTLLEKYGDPNYTNVAKIKKTKEERYGNPNYNNYEKFRKTCIDRYGVDHQCKIKEVSEKISRTKKTAETQQRYEKTMLDRYGETASNRVPSIQKKRLETLMSNYGVKNPLQSKEIFQKRIETMKKNGSFNKSKDEEILYKKLSNQFGEQSIKRQYKDSRYPFMCDFYIEPLDVFIEVNFHPSHGYHLFDPDNKEDILFLEELKSRNDDWSNMIIDVWSRRDYEKYQHAVKNNLKFIAVYPDVISMTKPCEFLETPILL